MNEETEFMQEITFTYSDQSHDLMMNCHSEFLDDIVHQFLHFLRGAGYVLPEEKDELIVDILRNRVHVETYDSAYTKKVEENVLAAFKNM